MDIHPIELAANNLPDSIWNTAKLYPEGRNVLLICLSRASKRTMLEVVQWLKDNNKEIFEIDCHKYHDKD